MTNIVPQAPNMNHSPWYGLKEFTRNTLVGDNNEALGVRGNSSSGGYNVTGLYQTIANISPLSSGYFDLNQSRAGFLLPYNSPQEHKYILLSSAFLH